MAPHPQEVEGCYLIVWASLLDQSQEIVISPVGVVEKDGTDIHIAKRIFALRHRYLDTRILLMLGDVSGAFRHVPIQADDEQMFAFVMGDIQVIDVACGFGWCGFPGWYHLPGVLSHGLYEQGFNMPAISPEPLSALFWCNDHTCIEPDAASSPI
ncbi:hypothetical protein GQ600_24873 [Phytophthora cactorum]|nr:hypothetical protein GQ600_24873 [Phytophthora cactorum]